MKSIRNRFHIVTQFSNLLDGHKKARLCKRGQKNIIDFEVNLNYNVYRLKHELETKTYKVGKYYKFFVNEPKRREIMAIDYRDRVVMHSLCDNVLGPFIENRLDYDNAACRKNKGTHFALNRLRKFIKQGHNKWGQNFYALKCDISKYFYSIRHDILKKHLYKYIYDKDIVWLLDEIIDSTEGNIGLPIGNMTSQWFAIFYLDLMDKFVREQLKVKLYTRYMDDFVLLHNNKNYLRECLSRLREFLDVELGLTLNDKTQIIHIKNGVDYVGFHSYLTKTGKVVRKLRKNSIKKMKRKIKFFNKRYSTGELSYEDVRNSVVSWVGHAKHGNTYKLRSKVLSRLNLIRKH